MKILKGTSVSKGIAFGYIYINDIPTPVAEKNDIQDPEREVRRFFKASADAFNHLQSLYEKTLKAAGEDHAQIFSIQQMMLQDNDYVNSIVKIITEEKVCAEYAVGKVSEVFSGRFLTMNDEMIRSKSYDITDISNHILRFLRSSSRTPDIEDASDKIIVSSSYVPSSMVSLSLSSASAAVAVSGMKKSHAAFLARKLQIPAIINTGVFDESLNGKYAAVNGFTGEIIIEPDENTVAALKKRQSRYGKLKGIVEKLLIKRRLDDSDQRVKLIALDLDGTILSNASNFSDKSIEAINAAADKGISVAVCTGRVFGEIPKEIRKIKGIKYFITSNGSSILNRDGSVLYSDTIERDAADKALDILSDYEVLVDLYIDGMGYMQRSDMGRLDYYNVTDGFDKVLETSRIMTDDIMDFYHETNPKLEKINLFFADQKERREAMYRISCLDPTPKIAYSMDYNLEVTSSTCCKGQGLSFLVNLLGIHMSEVMAVGDSNNDISMLKLAGISVAMGNSPDSVKDTAVYITDTCENDGAVKAIKKYALK